MCIQQAKEKELVKLKKEISNGAVLGMYHMLFSKLGIESPDNVEGFEEYFMSVDAVKDLNNAISGGHHAN